MFEIAPNATHDLIRRRLVPHFAELSRFANSHEMEISALFHDLAADIRTALDAVDQGDFRRCEAPPRSFYRMVTWNIERGMQLPRQIAAFQTNEHLRRADVIFLTETDVGMARSNNVDVARTMAQELGFSYVFAPCYLNLVKGAGLEKLAPGENELGLHGNALLSRYPIRDVRTVSLSNCLDKMAGNEKRLGSQRAIVAVIDLPESPFTAVCEHLDVLASQRHRREQMRAILNALDDGSVGARERVIIGGDWNTNTFDASHPLRVILGFAQRVLMGVDHTIRNHCLHPETYFEKQLFGLLEARGYEYRESNQLGEHTVSYSIADRRSHMSLAEWNPGAGFGLIRWALRKHNGRCPMKLDWFATRGVRSTNPCVLHEERDAETEPLSDHDAVSVDILA